MALLASSATYKHSLSNQLGPLVLVSSPNLSRAAWTSDLLTLSHCSETELCCWFISSILAAIASWNLCTISPFFTLSKLILLLLCVSVVILFSFILALATTMQWSEPHSAPLITFTSIIEFLNLVPTGIWSIRFLVLPSILRDAGLLVDISMRDQCTTHHHPRFHSTCCQSYTIIITLSVQTGPTKTRWKRVNLPSYFSIKFSHQEHHILPRDLTKHPGSSYHRIRSSLLCSLVRLERMQFSDQPDSH